MKLVSCIFYSSVKSTFFFCNTRIMSFKQIKSYPLYLKRHCGRFHFLKCIDYNEESCACQDDLITCELCDKTVGLLLVSEYDTHLPHCSQYPSICECFICPFFHCINNIDGPLLGANTCNCSCSKLFGQLSTRNPVSEKD